MGARRITLSGSKSVRLQPVLGDVGWREQIVLGIFPLEGDQQVFAAQLRVRFGIDGSFDGEALGALDDGGDDGAAGKVAAVKEVAFAAAEK